MVAQKTKFIVFFVASSLGVFVLFQNFTLYKNQNSLTFYEKFQNANSCLERFVDFDLNKSEYVKTKVPAECWNQPFRFTVTHENRANTKRGDKNWNEVQESIGFMSDFTQDHFGLIGTPKTFFAQFTPLNSTSNILQMGSNTSSWALNAVTGRPYGDGFLFMGVSDGSIWPQPQLALDKDFFIDFSYRIVRENLGVFPDAKQFNAHRVTLGFNIDWKEEDGRKNRDHFLEFDLFMSKGYFDSRKVEMSHPSQCPQDDGIDYDFCYTDRNPEGKYVDGKYLSLSSFADQPADFPLLNQWRRVRIPLSTFIRTYGWQHVPVEGWGEAILAGMYFGIESQGSQELQIQIKDYKFSQGVVFTPFAKVPEVPFRVSKSLFIKQESSYCALVSLGHLQAYNYTEVQAQTLYENAPLLMAQLIDKPFAGTCKLPSVNRMYRAQTLGLFSNGEYICHFESQAHFKNWGFSQQDYDQAPQLGKDAQLNFNYIGKCP